MTTRVRSLSVAPMKSARRSAVPQLDVTVTGIQGSHEFLIFDPKDHRVVTGRDLPEVVLFEVPMWDEYTITLTHPRTAKPHPKPGREPLYASHTFYAETKGRGIVRVAHFEDSVPVFDLQHSEWISDLLGRRLHLARRCDAVPRVRKGHELSGSQDQHPVHALHAASLGAFNSDLEGPSATAENFRVDIEFDTEWIFEPYSEMGWLAVRIGDVVLCNGEPKRRCQMPAVDPRTGTRSMMHITRRLAKLQTRHTAKPNFFGVGFDVKVPGTIRVGDEVEVLESRP